MRDAASEIIWTYQEITHGVRSRTNVRGEDFGIAWLIGTYYAYDDVPLSDDDAKRELDADLLEELRKLASATCA